MHQTLYGILSVLGLAWFLAADPGYAQNACTHTPSDLDTTILAEINRMRQDPVHYAFGVEDLTQEYQGKRRKIAEDEFIDTAEGIPAVEEAVRALSATRPEKSLAWDACLSQAAWDHVQDTGPKGIIGHVGSRGQSFLSRIHKYKHHFYSVAENISYGSSTPEDVVQELLIDDGVANRGHRKNLLNPSFNAAGVACGPHERYGTMCVIDFAQE